MTELRPTAAALGPALRRLLSVRLASRFVLIGLASTALYALLFLAAERLLPGPAWRLSLGAYAVAALFSYVGHRALSFRSSRPHAAALAHFIPLTAAGLAVASLLPAFLCDWLGWPAWFAAAVTCVAVPGFNAVMLSWLVFPPEPAAAAVDRPRSAPDREAGRQAVNLAICCAAALAIGASFLSPGFISGEGEVWRHALSDRATGLTGYLYFVAKPWTLSLFRLEMLAGPEGSTLINSDSIPIAALLGRIASALAGRPVNLLGAHLLACLVLNAAAAVLLLRRLGVRDLPRQLAVAVIFASLPFWLIRYYHVSLAAHALIIFAILVYLGSRDGRPAWRSYGAMAALIVIACLTHIYLWAMVMMVAGAMIANDLFDGRARLVPRFGRAGALLGVSLLAIGSAGYLDLRSAGENVGYMSFSANLLSFVTSSHSGLSPRSWELLRQMHERADSWSFFAAQRPDATGGQFIEGMAYLGAGVLALVALAVLRLHRLALGVILRRHAWLCLAALVALLFAVSPQITFGEQVLTRWQPSPELLSMLSAFRAGGRFVWLPLYLLIFATVMVVARTLPLRASQGVLAAAALLQLFDAHPLRSAIRFDSGHGIVLFNEAVWRPVLADARGIVILPSFECSDEARATVKTGLHLLAARLGPIPINSASQSRSTKDCARERALLDEDLMPGRVYFLFDADPFDAKVAAFRERHAPQCRPFAFGAVCRAGGVGYDACLDPLARPQVPACAVPSDRAGDRR